MIEWATHHKDDPPPPEDEENKEKRTDDIEPWDQEFLKVDQGTLFELILVSEQSTHNVFTIVSPYQKSNGSTHTCSLQAVEIPFCGMYMYIRVYIYTYISHH